MPPAAAVWRRLVPTSKISSLWFGLNSMFVQYISRVLCVFFSCGPVENILEGFYCITSFVSNVSLGWPCRPLNSCLGEEENEERECVPHMELAFHVWNASVIYTVIVGRQLVPPSSGLRKLIGMWVCAWRLVFFYNFRNLKWGCKPTQVWTSFFTYCCKLQCA